MNELEKQDNTGMTLSERLRSKREEKVLLCDYSGSMGWDCEPGYKRIEALRDTLKEIPNKTRIYAFNTSTRPVKDANDIPNPQGGTRMAQAFEYLKREGVKSIILLSDGAANDPTQALAAAAGLSIQIMYIGPGEKPDFLDKLAALSGGFATKEDLTKPKLLADKVTKLLGPAAQGAGAIIL